MFELKWSTSQLDMFMTPTIHPKSNFKLVEYGLIDYGYNQVNKHNYLIIQRSNSCYVG